MLLRRIPGVLAVTLAMAALSAAAVDGWELTSTDVRNAYFLGQRKGDQALYEFLAAYEKKLSAVPGGFDVWSVAVSTPYHQVVERSRRFPNYNSQLAQRDYKTHRGRILVTATVYLPLGRVYPFGDNRIWDDFDLRLVQDGRPVLAQRLQREPVYSFGGDGALTGFLLRAEFSTQQVARGPVAVEVITAEKNTVTAQFDLARLK